MIENIGFSELLVVGLVALLVIGPERLPSVARSLGFWVGKIRRIAASMKEELKEELHAEEIRQMLKDQTNHLEDLQGVFEEMNSNAHKLKSSFEKVSQPLEQSTPHEKP